MTVLAVDQADRPLVYECGACKRRYNWGGELIGTPHTGHHPQAEGQPQPKAGTPAIAVDRVAVTAARWRALQPHCTYCGEAIDGGPAGWYSLESDEETCSRSPSGFHEEDRRCA